LGEEGLSSKCAGARSEEKSNKGVAAKCDKLGYFVDLYFPQVGHYPMTEAQILSNKFNKVLVFPWGFFQGYFTQKLTFTLCLVSYLCFRYNVSLKTQLCFYSIK
jgi:hypothetical protein